MFVTLTVLALAVLMIIVERLKPGRTSPYWIGYVIQRPESHLVHHQRGLHAYNYGDLPLWDMMFGTFRNPNTFDEQCGFEQDRELRVGDLLLGRDVNA